MGAIMYDVSDAYVESTLSRRLIVAVFIIGVAYMES